MVEVGSKGFIKKLDLKESGLLKKRGQWFQSTSGERGLKPVLKGFSNFIHKATGNTNQPVKVGGENAWSRDTRVTTTKRRCGG